MRRIATLLMGSALALGSVVPVAAHGATCSDFTALAISVHGHHVVRDYVIGGDLDAWPPSGGAVGAVVAGRGAAVPGGPGPGFHFPNGFAPGASFCLSQSNSPGFHVP
jgi:hypothetical protein